MYTQHSKIRAGQVVPLAEGEAAPTVRLLGQGGDHRVSFIAPGDEAPTSLPSHEFFGTYREAFPAEIAATEKAFKPAREPAAAPAK